MGTASDLPSMVDRLPTQIHELKRLDMPPVQEFTAVRRWSGYVELVAELERLYRIRVQTLDAANFGVPQQRRRLFIVCDRESDPPDLSRQVIRPAPTVMDILDSAGTWPTKPLFNCHRAEATLERARRAIKTLGEGVPFLVVYYGSDGAGGWQTLDRPLRTVTTLDRFGLVEWTSDVPTYRMLQIPELKRAMGFDDRFCMRQGSRRDKIKILGNAVAPPLITEVLRRLCGDALRLSKILALAVRPQVNLPKHLAGAIPTFSYTRPIFQEP
jgi:DNA (cytosine-5)-methyltransferase 1